MKVGVLSLGCPRNLVDTESILGRLAHKGFRLVRMQDAEVAILNTCAFIQDAKTESIDAILDLIELKKEGKLKKIIVYGCLAQRYPGQLAKEFPEVDAFVGRSALDPGTQRYSLTGSHFAYLKICEGCVNRCSYCIIPQIKKAFASLPEGRLVAKAMSLERSGISELNIIGQDITGYGRDLYSATRLERLVKRIASKTRIPWIRLLYLYPSRVSDELLQIIRDEPRLCKYLDIPVQHVNDRILRLMNRRSSKAAILRLIDRARRIVPGIALRTSIIVGFPSETEKEFAELLSFIREVRFERLGAFVYSREEGTAAYGFSGQVPEKTKRQRFQAVLTSQQLVSEQVNSRFLGKSLPVLIEEKKDDIYLGRTEYDAPEVDGMVYVRSKRILRPGDMAAVRITDTMEYDLSGEA